MKLKFVFVFLYLMSHVACNQVDKSSNHTMNKDIVNPLLCDPEKGICETPQNESHAHDTPQDSITQDKITIHYFTDPICSSCWGIEPQLRKLKLEYGHLIDLEYHMGGLLPDWSYNSGGISKPSDVAHHWDEVALYYHMPIDGDIWLEDPLDSSYPPSIAFKAAQMQDEVKAIQFLRILREYVFLHKKNITKWEYISQAAMLVNLDATQLKQDYQKNAQELFQQDLALSRKMGVRGFPTLIYVNSNGQAISFSGFQPYAEFEKFIQPHILQNHKKSYHKDWEGLFNTFATLTTREYAELSEKSMNAAQVELDQLKANGQLQSTVVKNGVLWTTN